MDRPRDHSFLATLLGLVDRFAWPLRASHYLELLNPLWTTHRLRARVVSVRDETADTRTLRLRPGINWRRHRAGQHVRVGLPIGGTHHVRTYSISSAPERRDECITITVKAVPGGRVSEPLARRLLPGAYLPISLPLGDFVLPEGAPVRPLFVSAGSGITPVMSMLRSLELQQRLHDVVLVHYVPRLDELIFAAELERLAKKHPTFRLHVVPTRSTPEDVRRFSAARLDALCPDWRERECWASGPQSLLDPIEACWRAAGLERHLHLERFHAPLAEPPAALAGGRVRFLASRFEAVNDGRTDLLRSAEQVGLNPTHGCRMGICHSCTARLVAGSVRDLRSNAVTQEPGARIQICVSAAQGDVDLDL